MDRITQGPHNVWVSSPRSWVNNFAPRGHKNKTFITIRLRIKFFFILAAQSRLNRVDNWIIVTKKTPSLCVLHLSFIFSSCNLLPYVLLEVRNRYAQHLLKVLNHIKRRLALSTLYVRRTVFLSIFTSGTLLYWIGPRSNPTDRETRGR